MIIALKPTKENNPLQCAKGRGASFERHRRSRLDSFTAIPHRLSAWGHLLFARHKLNLFALILISLALLAGCGDKGGDSREAGSPRTPSSYKPAVVTGQKIALVIGNSAYPEKPLKNPVNDAGDMAERLKALGFEVTVATDASQKQMLRALTEFGEKVSNGAVALFYYAGHGMQVRGKNYLIPVDAQIKTESAVSSEAVDVDQLLAKLGPARLSMVILDACRNNPFERAFRGDGQGLAQINAPTGTLIAYATAPGKVSADGEGRNGTYTAELLAAMSEPGLKIEDVFKRVRGNVVSKTGNAQTPWESSSLTGDFYFMTAAAPPPAVIVATPTAMELSFWDSIKTSQDKADFEEYLRKFPDGQFAGIARNRVKALGGEAAPLASSSSDAKTPAVPKAFKDCADCPEMVEIPTGSFQMGSNDDEDNIKPLHTVTIARPFAIGKTEVTQKQWMSVMGYTESTDACGDNCAAGLVTLADAREFIKRLNARTGKSYRLPSEAEWEYSCRAGERYRYCGSNDANAVAWHKDNSDVTSSGSGRQIHPVAGKRPNAWGLYDMTGNVMEWVEDCWHENFNGAPNDGSAWTTVCERGDYVLRGEAVDWPAQPATIRVGRGRGYRHATYGFRLARSLLYNEAR